MGNISDEYFKRKLIQDDSQSSKKTAILQIFELVNTVVIENINNIYNNIEIENIIKSLENCNNVRKYSNNELFNVSLNYFQSVPFIQTTFYTYGLKVNTKTDKNNFLSWLNGSEDS